MQKVSYHNMLENNIKKIYIFGITSLLPLISFAEGTVILFGKQICANDPCRLSDVLTAIETFIRFLAVDLAMPIAVVAIAYAGFKMIMSSGNPGEVGKAKNIIYNALLGVFLAFTAYLIIKAIIFGLTAGGTPEDIINRTLDKQVN